MQQKHSTKSYNPFYNKYKVHEKKTRQNTEWNKEQFWHMGITGRGKPGV